MSLRSRLRLALPLVAAGALFFAAAAAAAEVVVLKSKDIGPYNLALEGFRSGYGEEVKTVTLDENGGWKPATTPDIAVAIGQKALTEALALPPTVPLIFLMNLQIDESALRGRSFVGIESAVPLHEHLALIEQALPSATLVGVLSSNPAVGEGVRTAVGRARLQVTVVKRPEDVPARFLDLLGRVDAVVLLPDPQVITKENVKLMLLKAVKERKPVFAYSEALTEGGALMSLIAPYEGMGRQAAALARKGAAALRRLHEVQPPKQTTLTINDATARSLGIQISPELRERAAQKP